MHPTITVPEELEARVFAAIREASVRRLRRRFIAAGSAFCAVCAFAVSAFSFIVTEARASQMAAYLKFLWTDSDIVLSNFGEYLYGLLERIPLMSLTLAIAGTMLLLGAIGFAQAFFRSTRRGFVGHSFAT